MNFVCAKCRNGEHCGDTGAWCDCQHRPQPVRRAFTAVILAAAVLLGGVACQPAQGGADISDCDAEDRRNKDVADCGPGVLDVDKKSTKKPVTVTKKSTVKVTRKP